jgi:tRNA (adenine57-N1/adenine58-N1)-methyltransferase
MLESTRLSTILPEIVREGELVLLHQDTRRRWITRAGEGRFHTHRGYLDLKDLVGLEPGTIVTTSMGQPVAVFKPRLSDIVDSFNRPTQILYPKDMGYAVYQLGLKNGDTVIEVGTGSGALTSAIAQAIAPDGRVYTYENRAEFARSAKKNVEKTGLSRSVTFRSVDPTDGFLERNAQAAVIDLGDPWKMVIPAWEALAGGGMLAGFTPTVNQLEKLAEALRSHGFLVLEAVEILVREFKTEAGKVRPESRMIGHTAYVTIARKILSKT